MRARMRRRRREADGSADEARRFAAAFDREDRGDLGRRAPLALLPLRIGWRRDG